ncbi:hypothetical protein RvY_10123 [Ramazzottius varieornatus]|uniref:BTB domain-containing protein n=1 Tax=Ramazzottius varieornatus TaxID=947166 RepID=A0A1D1VH37_RAMVA|nr:hypothetical protein RvY_10123 [Ramazzottius varieornatus]
MADASTTLNYVLPKDGSPGICDYSSPCVLLPSDTFIRIAYLRERMEESDNLKVRAEVECSMLDSTSFQESFRRLHESPVGRDFTLVSSDGTEELVHKAILIARSPVFSAVFESNLSESQTGRCTIDDVASSVLDVLVKYMYCSCSDKDVTEKAKEVLLAADKYQLRTEQCELNLIGQLAEGNIVDMLLLTDGVAAPALRDASFRYLKTNSTAVKSAGVIKSLCEQGSPQLVAEIVTYLLPA